MDERPIQPVYLMDANSFIAPFRNYYAMGHFPSYWAWLADIIKNPDSRVNVPKVVYNELISGGDHLSQWPRQNLQEFAYGVDDDGIWQRFGEIINYVHESGCYRGAGMVNWDQQGKADPLLIAIASVKGWQLVTFEQPSGNISARNPTKKEPKIPDVAKKFGVACVNLYDVEKTFGLSI